MVFSRTLRKPLEWNNSRLAKADLVEEVRSLKTSTDDPLRTIGSLSVVKALMEAGVVDRLRLVVFPQILGDTGREPVFPASRTSTGTGRDRRPRRPPVTLEYRPANANPTG
jgi:dihydrofolate reductase